SGTHGERGRARRGPPRRALVPEALPAYGRASRSTPRPIHPRNPREEPADGMVHPTIRRNTFVIRVLPFLLLAGGTSVFSGEETSTPAKDSAVAPARPPELEAAIEFQRAG